MRAISSISFSGQLEDKITAAAENGFDAIELFREDIIGFEGTPDDIGPFAREAGIKILSLQSLRDFEGLTGTARTEALARAEKFLDLAQRIGAEMLILCANTRADSNAAGALEDLRLLADMAASRGLKVGYEALASSRQITSVTAAYEAVKAVGRANFGLVIGTVHLFASASGSLEDALATLREIEPKDIFLVHLADTPTTRIDPALIAASFRLFPGQGTLPVAALYSQLLVQGFEGPLSIETFNDQIRSLPATRIAEDAMRAFHLLEETHARGAHPRSDMQAPGLVEFTAQGEDADDFIRLFTALGFAKTHENGAVSLWQQGQITLALNTATSGLAHSIYLVQGASVSGVGLVVNDMPLMLDRIGRFHGEAVELAEPYGLARLRGPGGSVLFLQPEAFTPGSEFTATGAKPGDGLTHIDHVAQALQPNLFLSGLLFYRATFDLRAHELRDVLDPHGTVHSRTLVNDSAAFRMSLNASFGAGTTTQRFLGKSGFAPFHHIALASDDIFGLAAKMEPQDLLSVPANYYEDLALRFDLAPDFIARLREGNLMYDRDERGTYLQLYTRAINGFFFEVVERRGYTGMGAANAPVRMLAQLREIEAEEALHLL
ncbi:4-hydroxyphenylpyruvate dioxygenase [Rhodobacter sp. JA431]|uniref:bifunctional sugar phosphate isomerase/epimerase/4-hydroxyphenylpyruvate dioxygenase family protein n=1 Tax=Rhodobacter sp. JA431 TaxID=570013 RepID=UPI000BDBB41D|nr:sugar phosphate isomerase/epimerase and 4-hydroxyphenylpyruvate domain-containing protein [Rhodobacter sp. JA431]SOC03887.1 4-hydroxyphenylpyruvate dioxygenase [Rhodobacter sp. JA431]